MAVLARTARAGALVSTPFLVLGASDDRGWGRFFVGLIIAIVVVVYLRRAMAADRERQNP